MDQCRARKKRVVCRVEGSKRFTIMKRIEAAGDNEQRMNNERVSDTRECRRRGMV